MNIEEFSKELINKSNMIEVNLNEDQASKFYSYMNLLVEWNEKMNLTAITEPNEVILKHFVDSLTISKYIDKGASLIDVGTGAGFPGIPLSIANEVNVTLLDSLNKRINFLNEVIKELDLENIEAIHSRAEDFGSKEREKYDIATSRAVASLNVLVEYLLPLVKVGGKCICMKGPHIEEEIENAKKAIKILGGELKRTIIIIKKLKETPAKYPRKAGLPSKEPIM